MKHALLVFAVLGLSAGPLAGCLSFLGDEEAIGPADVNEAAREFVDNRTQERIESRLSATPKNYTFPLQQVLTHVTEFVNGTIDTAANTAVVDRNDRGGNSYNLIVQTTDVAKNIPVGQPTEMHITLFYANQPGSSARCKIIVDVPGTQSDYDKSNNDEFSWKFSVQRMVVNTVGVAGAKHEVGVACGSGKMTGPLPYTIRIDYGYAKDVLTPYHPWAFTVPEGAGGIILESEKAGGPEHLRAWFLIIGPNDELVQFVDFNDIAIPTESVFVRTDAPGEYIFYAINMTGGFLRLRADSPVDQRSVRPLAVKMERVVDHTGPSPGLAERNIADEGVMSPAGGGQETNFNVDGTFPLRIEAFIGEESGSNTAFSDVKISSGKGLVASLQRVMRHDDGSGSLGLSRDELNTVFQPWNLAKGAFTVQIVNNSPDAAVGHVVTTYQR